MYDHSASKYPKPETELTDGNTIEEKLIFITKVHFDINFCKTLK